MPEPKELHFSNHRKPFFGLRYLVVELDGTMGTHHNLPLPYGGKVQCS